MRAIILATEHLKFEDVSPFDRIQILVRYEACSVWVSFEGI